MMPPYNIKSVSANISLNGNPPTPAKPGSGFRRATDAELNHELFNKNLSVWKSQFPKVGEYFAQMTPVISHLLINDAGEFDISYRDRPLLGMGSKSWVRRGFDGLHKTVRLIDFPDGAEGIETEIVDRITEQVKTELNAPVPAQPLGPECYHLVVFGLALADHIPPMTEVTRCQTLVLVEPNLEFLYLSLFTFDWGKFFREFVTGAKTLQIILEGPPKTIQTQIYEFVRNTAPHYLEGMTIVNTYPDSHLENTSDLLVEKAAFMNGGMGFFLDSCDMMRNAYGNLKSYNGLYYKRHEGLASLPAFVVGSGPSLDGDIDFIRDNQDKAVIVSCGTSLRILLSHGITPDFHVELENIPMISDIVGAEAKAHDLSSTTLIAAFTVDPGVPKHFTDPVLYFRTYLSPSPIFSMGEDTSVELSSPTVANLGFSFAQECACREIYLFGVDLGARDIKRHHAEGSVYHSDEAPYEDILDIAMPANFGGDDILTDAVFLWSKSALEQGASRYPGTQRKYFNCSDGMRLEGITPLRSAEISLPEQPSKRRTIEAMKASFPRYSPENFSRVWDKEERKARIKEYRDRLLACLDADFTAEAAPTEASTQGLNRQARRKLAKSKEKQAPSSDQPNMTYASPNDGNRTAFECDFAQNLTAVFAGREFRTVEQCFFNGGLFYPLRALHYYATRIPPGPARQKIIDYGKREIDQFIRYMGDEVLDLYDKLD